MRLEEKHVGPTLLAAAALLLAACAATPEAAPETVPAEVSEALLPPLGYTARAPAGDPRRQRFDVNVREVPARAFFMSLVEGTPYNIVVQPGVRGEITLVLKNVTVPEVMDHARDAFGYDWIRTAGGYTVLAESMQTRQFRVNYLNVTRSGKSRISVSSGQLTHKNGSEGGGLVPVAGAATPRGTMTASGIETRTDSDFWKDVDQTLHLLVPSGGGRRLVINPDAGLVVVRAMTSELKEVERYLRTLQANLTRQVILEAKILEVQLNESFQAGINWAAFGTTREGYSAFGAQTGGQSAFANGVSDAAGTPITIDPATGAFTVPALPTTAIGGALTAVLNVNDFSAVIELLQGQGDVKVLSSPRVATVNNQKAIIKVGSDEFFITGVQANNTLAGAGTTQNSTVEFTPFFSGIALDVTPQIDEQGIVTLHVHPTVSEVRDDEKRVTVQGQVQTFPLALSNVREADSIVRARSGQIIVIGGLMQESTRDERFGVPLLSRLPLIGALFRQTRVASNKSELVILLKPLVVDSDEQWAEEVRQRQLQVQDVERRHRRWWN